MDVSYHIVSSAILRYAQRKKIVWHTWKGSCILSASSVVSHMATDSFAAAGKLQNVWSRTSSVDLGDARLFSDTMFIHDVDATSGELYIYDKVIIDGCLGSSNCFWGHFPLHWMHRMLMGFTLHSFCSKMTWRWCLEQTACKGRAGVSVAEL